MKEGYNIDNLIRGDQDSFRKFVVCHQKDVYRLSFRFVSSHQDAEDITQEVFIEAFRSLSAFRKQSSLSTWLYRITVNRSLNFIKRNKKHAETKSLDFIHNDQDTKFNVEFAADQSFEPSARMENAELKKNISIAIDSLSENQKTAFVLHKFEGMPYSQIADIMKISLSAVESHIHRAKIALQKKLLKFNKEKYHSTQVFKFQDVKQ